MYKLYGIFDLEMSRIDEILKHYKSGRQENLIPILQEIQQNEGYLTEKAITEVAHFLRMSTTKIFGLATFYDQFRFLPTGRVHLKICNGTSCFINGSGAVVNALRETLGIEAGQTTRDGRFSYELTSCMGGCNEGPVVCISGDYATHVSPDDIPDMITRMKALADMK